MHHDTFELYDLHVELIAFRDDRRMTNGAKIGDSFEVRGENIFFPEGQGFSFYNLAAIIPLLAAKQRVTNPNDWMTTDTDVSAVDIHCGAVFRITRTGRRLFRHSDVSGIPLDL
ncbi:MAG TPA: TIGR04076 family protein [bacterium]|nr:TIGR04076 family protein [bacterium]